MVFDSLLHRSPCFLDVNFATLVWNPVDYMPLCLAGSMVSFDRAKCDQSVMSDLKTVQIMPCCSRQRQRGSSIR